MSGCQDCYYSKGKRSGREHSYKCTYPEYVRYSFTTKRRGWYAVMRKDKIECNYWKLKVKIKLPNLDESDLDNLFL